MSDQYAPGTVLSPEEAGIQDEPPPAPVSPADGPAIHGESQVGAGIRGLESGALANFNSKGAAAIDTAVAKDLTYGGMRAEGHSMPVAAAGALSSWLLHHPWMQDFAVKISGDETLRDPSLSYEQRLEKYKQAAAESAAKYPITTVAGTVAGAALPTLPGGGARVVTKGAEGLAERAIGAGAAKAVRTLAPAAEGAAQGALMAEGADTDHAHGAAVGAALGLAPSVAAAAARPLSRILRKIPFIGGAPERIKPIQDAANAAGLGIKDTQAEASRLMTKAGEDPVVKGIVLDAAPTHEGANHLAQHTVDLKNVLVATALDLPKATAAGVRNAITAMAKAVEGGDLKALREASVEAAKEVARSGLDQGQQADINTKISRLDTAARLAASTARVAPHAGPAGYQHPFVAAASGNPGPALAEAAAGIAPGRHIMAAAVGGAKAIPKAIDRKVAAFIHAGETGETAGVQGQARELMTKTASPTRSLLAAIQAKHGVEGNADEPVHTGEEMAKALKAQGLSDHEVVRILGDEYIKPLEKKLRGEGKLK